MSKISKREMLAQEREFHRLILLRMPPEYSQDSEPLPEKQETCNSRRHAKRMTKRLEVAV